VQVATPDDRIAATVLVGSGVTGFRDALSDLDLLYVVDAGDALIVERDARDKLTTELDPTFRTSYQHRDDVVVTCFLLDGGLEVDLGVWGIADLFAVRSQWSIVSARDPDSRREVETCLRERPPPRRPYEPIVSGDDPLWQLINAWRVAMARRQAENADQLRHELDRRLALPSGTEAYLEALQPAMREIYEPRQCDLLTRLLHGI
jgi:hypothetical protein